MSNLCLGSQRHNIKLIISLQDQLVTAVLATISGVFSEPRGGHKYAFWKNTDIIYCISTVNTQHMQIPDVLVQLGYIWRHVSAVKRPFSGQQRTVLLSTVYCTLTILFFVGLRMAG